MTKHLEENWDEILPMFEILPDGRRVWNEKYGPIKVSPGDSPSERVARLASGVEKPTVEGDFWTQADSDERRQMRSDTAPENLDFTGVDLITRQEFKDEVDINQILLRYGPYASQRIPVYGERDMQLELQTAFELQEKAKQFRAALPHELQVRYPTVAAVLEGIADGTLTAELEKVAQERAEDRQDKSRKATAEEQWRTEQELSKYREKSSSESARVGTSQPNSKTDKQ